MKKLNPEDLQNQSEFELLTEVSHQNLREFVVEQIQKEKYIIRIYSIHSLFCAGDMAMLAFYNLYRGKEIYNYDSLSEGKTYFYIRKKTN